MFLPEQHVDQVLLVQVAGEEKAPVKDAAAENVELAREAVHLLGEVLEVGRFKLEEEKNAR